MIDWLLNGEPREAQLEALRRSYKGIATRDSVDGPTFNRPVPGHPGNRPIKGWGHLLEMRVGKTPTHLNEGALLRRDYDFRWHIVLAPNAFKEDWAVEAEKFGYPADAIALDSGNRKKVQSFISKHQRTGGLIAVNYEALRYDATLNVLADVVGDRTLIGADESISIKNPASGDTKAALALATECGIRRIMTGKPVTQGAHDLWAQMRFIGQLNGIMPAVFRNTYCQLGGFQGKQIVGVKNEDHLQEMLDRCSFKARKRDWLKTPGKDYATRKLSLLPDQAAKYERMQKDFMVEIAEGVVVTADQVITKLMKMQQIASGFIIDEEGTVHQLMPPEKNPKAIEMRRILEEDVDTKIIVVCHYQHSIDILEKALGTWKPAIIRGKTWHKKQEDRSVLEEKARFNNDPSCRVLIGQEQALRYGHTLMGNPFDPCYTTIFYENNHSLNDRSQCEERNQGEGQLQPISILDFLVTPEDLKVIRALQRKEDVASVLLGYERDTGVLPYAS